MAHDNAITDQMRERQHLLRLALDRRGIALKAVSHASGIPYPTLLSYLPGRRDGHSAMMPLSALCQLFNAVPDDLLSILTEPEGRVFATVSEDGPLQELVDARAALERAIAKVGGAA